MRDLVGRRRLQHLLELAVGVVEPACVERIHGEVLARRIEGGIEAQRFAEARVGLVAAAGAGQRDPGKIERLEIGG